MTIPDGYSGDDQRIEDPRLGLLRSKQCAGLDLRGLDLSGWILSHGVFTGANFSGVNLTGTSFYHADLSCANLEGAILYRANLSHANLINARLAGAKMDPGTDTRRADCSGTVLAPSRSGIVVQVSIDPADGSAFIHLKNVPLPPGYLPGPEQVEGVRSLGAWGKETPEYPVTGPDTCILGWIPDSAVKWPIAYHFTTSTGPDDDSNFNEYCATEERDPYEPELYDDYLSCEAGFGYSLVTAAPATCQTD